MPSARGGFTAGGDARQARRRGHSLPAGAAPAPARWGERFPGAGQGCGVGVRLALPPPSPRGWEGRTRAGRGKWIARPCRCTWGLRRGPGRGGVVGEESEWAGGYWGGRARSMWSLGGAGSVCPKGNFLFSFGAPSQTSGKTTTFMYAVPQTCK